MSVLLILAGSLFVNAAMRGDASRSAARWDGRRLAVLLLPALLSAACVEYALWRWVLPAWEQTYLQMPVMVALMIVCMAASLTAAVAIARKSSEVHDRESPQAMATSSTADSQSKGTVMDYIIEQIAASRFTGERLWLLSNAALLGVAWCALPAPAHFLTRLLKAAVMAGVFVGATVLSRALSVRIDPRKVPAAFRGLPVALTTAGLAALALMAMTGLG